MNARTSSRTASVSVPRVKSRPSPGRRLRPAGRAPARASHRRPGRPRPSSSIGAAGDQARRLGPLDVQGDGVLDHEAVAAVHVQAPGRGPLGLLAAPRQRPRGPATRGRGVAASRCPGRLEGEEAGRRRRRCGRRPAGAGSAWNEPMGTPNWWRSLAYWRPMSRAWRARPACQHAVSTRQRSSAASNVLRVAQHLDRRRARSAGSTVAAARQPSSATGVVRPARGMRTEPARRGSRPRGWRRRRRPRARRARSAVGGTR